MGDYYTEDIPVAEDEEEILELLPIVAEPKAEFTPLVTSASDPDDQSQLIIDEDASEVHLRAKTHMEELEKVLKNNLLYNNDKSVLVEGEDYESRLRNKMFRFKMLQNELRSLQNEINNEKDYKEEALKHSIDKMVSEIEDYQKDEDQTKWCKYWESRLRQLKEDNEIVLKEMSLETKDHAMDKSIAEFDSRLGKLESTFLDISAQHSTLSLQNTIDDLYRRTNLILDNGESLEKLQTKIIKLFDEYESLSRMGRLKTPVSLTDEKLQLIYDRLKSMPKFEILVPLIMQRLKCINRLVINAASSLNFVNDIETQFTKIETQVTNWNNKLDALEHQMEINYANFVQEKEKVLKEFRENGKMNQTN